MKIFNDRVQEYFAAMRKCTRCVVPDEHGMFSTVDKFRLMAYYGLEYTRHLYNYHPAILGEYIREALQRLEKDHQPRFIKLEKGFKAMGVTLPAVDASLREYRKKLLPKVLTRHYDTIEIV